MRAAGAGRGDARLSPSRSARPRRSRAIIGKLAAELCAALEARGLGARRLDLLFHRVDNRIAAIRIGTARPVRDAKRLTRLLCDKIETIDPGFGIERMTLIAVDRRAARYARRRLELGEAPAPDVADLIDTLANRVGARRLYRVAPVESDVPERSVRRVAPLAPPTPATWLAGHWPRPARLLPPPEPIETVALLPDHPPVDLHLARRAPPGEARRRPRAGLRRMVDARRRDWPPCATISRSRTRRASASGCSAPATARIPPPARSAGSCMACSDERRYAELQCTSHFSFLRGASSCEELFATAAELGIEALAIADRNSLAGIVRAHEAAKATGVRLIVGCRLDLADGTSLLVYPTDRAAYARLCRLLSLGKRRGGKGACRARLGRRRRLCARA